MTRPQVRGGAAKLPRAFILAASLALVSCGGSSFPPAPDSPVATVAQPQPAATGWEIGPWIGPLNYSKDLPLHPAAATDGSFYFDFGPTGEPHYITEPAPPFSGKSEIRASFRIDGDPDAVIHGAGCAAGSASFVTLYFAAAANDWSSDGQRWWASFAPSRPLRPGMQFTLVAPLAGARWTSVLKMNSTDNPDAFAAAKASAGRVGFTFANCTGYGHGAAAAKPVRFTVLDFSID